MATHLRIPVLDLGIIVAYIVAILTIGILSTRKSKVTGQVFFLAGRSLPWGVVGAALFASNISTIHLVGLTASGYNEGLVWGNFEWMAAFTLILLSLVFAPFYFRSRISTLPEFLEKRYSPGSRSFLAFMAIVAALFIHIGMSIYAGAEVFQQFFGIDVFTSIHDRIDCCVLVYGARWTQSCGCHGNREYGFSACRSLHHHRLCSACFAPHGVHSIAQFKAAVKPDQLKMLQSHSSAGLNWWAVFLGYPVLGVWYWCTDQTIVQRVLGPAPSVMRNLALCSRASSRSCPSSSWSCPA